jgi:dipeptidyl aminopeptidase/acylaminoacyl peptidase
MGFFFFQIHAQSTEPILQEDVKLIPRSLLFGNPEKTAPQLSPDGSKIAYLAPDVNGVLNVWVRNLNQPGSDQKVTSDSNRGVHGFFWRQDGQYIDFMQDNNGDENWHLYQTNLQSKETKELTPFSGVLVRVLDFDHKYPDELLIGMNKRDPTLFDVFSLNVKTGELKLIVENPGDVFHWIADHNLQVRASLSYKKDGSSLIRVRDSLQSPWRDLLTIDPNETGVAILSFTPDNTGIYILTSLGGNTERLLQVDLNDGKQKLIFEDPRFDISSVFFHPTNYSLQAIAIDREHYEWEVIDSNLKADFNYLSQNLKTPFLLTSVDRANQNWIVASISDVRPTHFYLYNRPQKKLTFLFSTQPALEKFKLSPMQPVTFQARDGMKLYAYLTLPVGKKPEKLPAILLVHGGPWERDYWGFQSQVQWLANRGYAILQVNYRGSKGFGKAYLNAGNQEWGGKMQTDLIDGKEWLIKNGFADPGKIAIYGSSYGGYAVLVGLAFTPDAFCCGVDIVGMSNLITMLQKSPPYWATIQAQTDVRLGTLEKDAEFLKLRSPLFKAEQIKKPLLIGQGANDPRVNQLESDQIVAAMRKKNLPVEYLLFPDEGHGFAKPGNRLKFNAAAEAFLAKYLGGRQEPPSKSENWESLKH